MTRSIVTEHAHNIIIDMYPKPKQEIRLVSLSDYSFSFTVYDLYFFRTPCTSLSKLQCSRGLLYIYYIETRYIAVHENNCRCNDRTR